MAACYAGTGISSAVYAAEWGKPPDACEVNIISVLAGNDCDDMALTATNALSAVRGTNSCMHT